MQPDHDTTATPVPRDMPEAHARDVIGVMRERGTSNADTERALLAAGRSHARVLANIGEPEAPE